MYYKDLEVWKEAIALTTEIYTITKSFPDDEKYGLVSQMRRAVAAIRSNIAEGSSRKSDKDTVRFIDIAIASLAELDTQIIISQNLGYLKDSSEIKTKIDKLFALLRGLQKYMMEQIKM